MDKDLGFIDGFICNKDRVFAIVSSEKLESRDIQHAFICYWKNGVWDLWDEDFYVTKVCAYNVSSNIELIEMGLYGEITVVETKGYRSEILDNPRKGPSRLRPLSDIRRIGNHIYVVGVRRQVYRRRLEDSKWQRSDNGVFIPLSSKEIGGFTSIDGFSDSEVYAVGYNGEIWRFDGSVWSQVTSPTNIRLESIRCINDDFAVAVGDQGIVLKGRYDEWDVIAQDLTSETFTDIELAHNEIYISTEVGLIYKLNHLDLTEVRIPIKEDLTTGYLHSNGEILLSVGERDLMLFDGSVWSEIPHPILPSV